VRGAAFSLAIAYTRAMRRLLAVVAVAVASAAVLAVEAGCSSFGTAGDVAADAGPDVPPGGDGSTLDGGALDGTLPPGARFCDGKSYVVCSDFEPPVVPGTGATTVGGWTSADLGNDLVVESLPAVPLGSRGQGLHVHVPVLADGVQGGQALRREVAAVPSELTFAATMQMGANSVTQYTELLSLDLIDDPSGLQVVLEMLDGNLVLTESARGAGNQSVSLLALGTLTALKPLRIEVHMWFSDLKNEIAVTADNGAMLAKKTLTTVPTGKPTGKLTFSAGNTFSLGSNGRSGGVYYLDDVTLQTTP
jgi:hypothetical protein